MTDETPRAKWKHYAVPIKIERRIHPTTESLTEIVNREFLKAQAAHQDMLVRDFLGANPPKPRPPRFRRWLGWKVWNVAARINPELLEW